MKGECVMTAVSRSCFALALLFQKLAAAKSEWRKKERSYFCVCLPFFHHSPLFSTFFHQNPRMTFFFFKKKRVKWWKKKSRLPFFDPFYLLTFFIKRPFLSIFLFFINNFPFHRPTSFKVAQRMMRAIRQTVNGPRPCTLALAAVRCRSRCR